MNLGPNAKAWVTTIGTSITLLIGTLTQALDDNNISLNELGLIMASVVTGISTVISVYKTENKNKGLDRTDTM